MGNQRLNPLPMPFASEIESKRRKKVSSNTQWSRSAPTNERIEKLHQGKYSANLQEALNAVPMMGPLPPQQMRMLNHPLGMLQFPFQRDPKDIPGWQSADPTYGPQNELGLKQPRILEEQEFLKDPVFRGWLADRLRKDLEGWKKFQNRLELQVNPQAGQ